MTRSRRRDALAHHHFGVCDLAVRVATSGLLVVAMWLVVQLADDPIAWAGAWMFVFFRDRALELVQ